MPPDDAPPTFQFYARDFLTSTAVALMSAEARGGYITLMCHAWLQPEPGVLPDDDSALSVLSGLGDRWPANSVAIRRAFHSTSREGRQVLVQRRMVREREAQRRRWEAASRGGRATSQKRWGSVSKQPPEQPPGNSEATTPASASASASEKQRQKIAAPAADASLETNGNGPAFPAIAGLTTGLASRLSLSRVAPRAPLMASVKPQVEALPSHEQARLYALAGWLAKTGVRDDECILRFIADAIPRLPHVRSFHAYYAQNGKARVDLEGRYRADQQERESAHWKAEEWEWLRRVKALEVTS